MCALARSCALAALLRFAPSRAHNPNYHPPRRSPVLLIVVRHRWPLAVRRVVLVQRKERRRFAPPVESRYRARGCGFWHRASRGRSRSRAHGRRAVRSGSVGLSCARRSPRARQSRKGELMPRARRLRVDARRAGDAGAWPKAPRWKDGANNAPSVKR